MKRECGTCTLCCKLLPVRAIGKLGGHRCKHQRFGGCQIYDKLATASPECRLWSCRWLLGDAGDTRRPDHGHIVIDIMPDIIHITDNLTGALTHLPVAQVWIDPKFPQAQHDPALRAWIEARAQAGEIVGAVIRFSPKTGFVLFPPCITGDGWKEDHTPPSPDVASLVDMMEEASTKRITT